MVKVIRAASAALALILSAGAADAQGSKIAFVNGRQLLEQAPGRAEAETMLEKEVKVWDAVAKKLGDSVTGMQKKFQDDQATLSPAVRDQRTKEITALIEKYTRTRDSLEQVVQRRQGELLQPILDMVNKILADVRTEDGLAIIHDLSAQNAGIVAFDKNLDITERVLARVKKLPAPKLPAAGAPATGAAGLTKIPPDR